MTAPTLEVLADPDALAHAVADWLLAGALAVERFDLCLSGGSTPKRLYALLASDAYRERFPWSRVNFWFGDERFVARDDPDSNYRMVDEAMFRHAPIPPANIHGMPASGTPEDAARSYERELPRSDTLFDVVLLGLGEDGHTASLFPGTAALDERTALVAAVIGAKPEPRLSLTYPALARSRVAAWLVTGADKTPMLKRLLADDQSIPAARVSAAERRVFADRAAAGA